MTKGEELMKMLNRYDFDLNTFLGMKDLWDGLKQAEKVKLIDEQENHLKKLHSLVSGNPSNVSKPNYENAHFNGEVD